VLVAVGVVISGSVAGYAMALPVLVISAFLIVDGKTGPLFIGSGLVIGVGLAVLAYVAITSPMLHGLGNTI